MALLDLVLAVARPILGAKLINRIAINRLVKAGPARPAAWSTLEDDYISWAGLTDKTWFSRLLPPDRGPQVVGIGTRHPPTDDLAGLFPAPAGQQVLCPKSTTLFPAFAQYLTDGFLRTRLFNTPQGARTRPGAEDRRRTTSNHEIDLSALYGRTEEQTGVLRTKVGGLLKSQMIGAEEFPPFLYGKYGLPKAEFCDAGGALVLDEPLGVQKSANKESLFAVGGDRVNASVEVASINTLFLREHNRLARMLAEENPAWDDERLFQTARNIVIVMFIRIVVEEYINHISSAPFRFLADPAVAWDASWNKSSWMSIEFTMLYRWHSLVPEYLTWKGEKLVPGATLLNNALLIRDGLAEALTQMSSNHAARMGLGNFASFFVDSEAKGIEQGRANDLRGYNDYREVMGLPRARSFAEVVGRSEDRQDQARRAALAAELERLYGYIDNLELYVGLFAEPCQKNSPIPELVLAMVAMDAFSQALPNPLLCKRIWTDPDTLRRAFTDKGVEEIEQTSSLRDILAKQDPGLGSRFIGMTRPGWKRS